MIAEGDVNINCCFFHSQIHYFHSKAKLTILIITTINRGINIMKFFSPDWAKELKNQINQNQEYKNSSEGWEWLLILSIKESPDKQSLLLDLYNGECREIQSASQDDINNCHFIISATKETWKKILTGSLSAMQAMMMKSLTIEKGNMSELLPYVNSLKELLNSAMKIETEFE